MWESKKLLLIPFSLLIAAALVFIFSDAYNEYIYITVLIALAVTSMVVLSIRHRQHKYNIRRSTIASSLSSKSRDSLQSSMGLSSSSNLLAPISLQTNSSTVLPMVSDDTDDF